MKPRNLLVAFVLVVLVFAGAYLALRKHAASPVPAASLSADQAAEQIQGGALTPERQRTFATLACGKPVTLDDKGAINCPVCPQNSDFAANPAEFGGWTYSGMLFGHFTSATADEALLNAQGCESHANNYGGDFLLRRQGGNWVPVRYLSGAVINEKCLRLPWPAGPNPGQSRDALVCEHDDMHSGEQESSVLLFTVAATAPADGPDYGSAGFLFLTDTTELCAPTHENPVQKASVDKINLLPAGANGLQDLEIVASIGRANIKPDNADCPYDVPATQPVRLVFHNMGDHFDGSEAAPRIKALQPPMADGPGVGATVRPGAY